MSNLVRKYKIHQIIPILTEEELEIYNYINDKLSGLEKKESLEYTSVVSVYYVNKYNEYIVEESKLFEETRILEKDFCEVLINKYKLEKSDIKIIIKYILEIKLKKKVFEIIFGTDLEYKYSE